MNIDEIVTYCLSRKNIRHEYKETWEADVFFIGEKMFAMIGEDGEGLPVLTLKCEPEEAIRLREHYPEIQPAYHMNKQHWNSIQINSPHIPDNLAKKMVDDSYALVFSKLPLRLQKELNG